MMNLTYECAICLHINHAAKLHCSTCGAVPAKYSLIKTTARIISDDYLSRWIPVVAAHGMDRPEWHHTRKLYLRTIPADYFC